MQLEYHILWFDDQLGPITPFVDRVKSIISRLGFEPKVDLRIITADIQNPLTSLPKHGIDLVLIDWKLGGLHDGAKIAKRLRQTFRDTDVVFYSSESAKTLRELIFKQDIDGVFCVHRTNLTDRVNGIIQGQLRRTLDLNHMRGLVMAATSDLDIAMVECLEVVQQVLHPEDAGAAFAASIAERVSKGLRTKADEVEQLGAEGKLPKLLREPAFGAFLRLEVLKEEVAKLADKVTEPQFILQLEKYHAEVITPRNDFAHRKAEMRDGKLVLEGRKLPLDQDSMKVLRLRLLDHSYNLRGLISTLRELAVEVGEQELADQVAAIEEAVEEAVEGAASAKLTPLLARGGRHSGNVA